MPRVDDGEDFDRTLDAAFMQALLAGEPHGDLKEVAGSHPKVVADMATCSGPLAAEMLAHLLTLPDLQANCLVVETLVCLALARGRGQRRPKRSEVAGWFRALSSGPYGQLQDPAEDLFVTRLPTPAGNYRIFEGLWEASRFHAQRFTGVLGALRDGAARDALRAGTAALLALSEEVARRSAVEANTTGREFPLKVLPAGTGLGEPASRRRVRFTPECLHALGVTAGALQPFILGPADWTGLADDGVGHSRLERRPLVRSGDDMILLLPTAVSAAFRRLVIESFIGDGDRPSLEEELASEYGRLLSSFPLLGGRASSPLAFSKVSGTSVAGMLQQVDEGRWVNWVFFVDDLEAYGKRGLMGVNARPDTLGRVLGSVALGGQAAAAQRPGFRSGLTVLVSCGWGRGLLVPEPPETPGWRQAFIPAADLETLSLLPGVTPLSLWRTLDSARAVREAGVRLAVPNGLLNLFAWERELDGALAPHSDMPDDFGHDGRAATVAVPQNGLLALRAEVARTDDARAALDGSGRFILMRRRRESLFAEDGGRAHVHQSWAHAMGGSLIAAFLGGQRPWWIEVNAPEGTPRRILFEHWEMLGTWLSRAAPILETAFPGLPLGPITWKVRFECLREWAKADGEPPDPEALDALLQVVTDRTARTVELTVPVAFEGAFRIAENVAEIALVSALMRGTAGLGGVEPLAEEFAVLVASVIPTGFARHIHFMQSGGYRDLVANRFAGHPVLIESQDTSLGHIGLAWLARPRGPGHEVVGKTECMRLLNDTVAAVESELCEALKPFGRREMLAASILNHETACYQRDRWHRTAAANIGLRQGRTEAISTIGEQTTRLNAVTLASRILIEAAACECPDTGARPGSLDLSRLMAKAMSLFRLGGWSDAIRWDAMAPALKVSSLGNIMAPHEFEEEILAPFGRVLADARTEQGIAAYPESYERARTTDAPAGEPDKEFLSAWKSEFDVGFGESMAFLRLLQDIGAERGAAVMTVRTSELMAACTASGTMAEPDASAMLELFVLRRRPGWRVPPPGYLERDRQPWRFRRRLSLMRRPIVDLDGPGDQDPHLLIAPGMVVDGAAYLVNGLLAGAFPHGYVDSGAMRSWLGGATNRAGHAFNGEVATRMRGLG